MKEKHIKNIEEYYETPVDKAGVNNVTETKSEEISIQTICCPKCGGKLLLRTAKNGVNRGKQFYGCSSYPKCHYIQNI
ncbi:MAG: topoisomerase DNA-binding C4 zinc finger domain-containing protein [Lachnospiraceae bacterium]|nr:topoisomerase DNA-binding C4 zinc finger domain-containing protein [Lachnospiraceae bacterium]